MPALVAHTGKLHLWKMRYTLSLFCADSCEPAAKEAQAKEAQSAPPSGIDFVSHPQSNFASASTARTQRTNYACAQHNILALALCCYGLRRPNWVKSNKACTSLSLRRINEIQQNIKCSLCAYIPLMLLLYPDEVPTYSACMRCI